MRTFCSESTPVLLFRQTQTLCRTSMSKVVTLERAEFHCMSCRGNTGVENTFYLPISHSRSLTWHIYKLHTSKWRSLKISVIRKGKIHMHTEKQMNYAEILRLINTSAACQRISTFLFFLACTFCPRNLNSSGRHVWLRDRGRPIK